MEGILCRYFHMPRYDGGGMVMGLGRGVAKMSIRHFDAMKPQCQRENLTVFDIISFPLVPWSSIYHSDRVESNGMVGLAR